MKKRVLFLALFGAISIASLTSCGNQDTSTITTESTIETTTKRKDYKIEDSGLSQMVYNEVLKSYPDLTYDDFRLNGDIQYGDCTVYKYDKLSIGVKNNEFVFKTIVIDGKYISSNYINNEWIKTSEGMYINGQYHYTYKLSLNSDGTFNFKEEATFDDAGNELVSTVSEYINNEWVIASFRNYKNNTGCSYHLNSDGTYEAKNESTYDDAGDVLTDAYSKYINGKWTIIECEDYEHKTRSYFHLDSNGIYKSRDEYTYDDAGNEATYVYSMYSLYENGEWAYISKTENTYDEKNRLIICVDSLYKNDTWAYDSMIEITYDDNGDALTETNYDYVDGQWVLQS